MLEISVINNAGTVKQCRMAEVAGFRIHKFSFSKEFTKIFWDHEFLSDVT